MREHRTLIVVMALLIAVVAWMVVEVQRAQLPVAQPAPLPPQSVSALPAPVFVPSRPQRAASQPDCDPDDASGAPQAKRQALEFAWPAWLNHADPQVQAAAHVLRAVLDGAVPDELPRMASVTNDPVVYSLAMQACLVRSDRSTPACAQVNAAQWARLEPDNAMPWFAVAEQARAQRDAAAEFEAMHRASHAVKSNPRWSVLASLLLPALPAGLSDRERALITTAVTGADASLLPVYPAAVSRFCEAPRLDANRRQTCEALAAVLLDKGLTALDRGVGLAVGRELGWSTDRLDSLKLEGAVLSDLAVRSLAPENRSGASCADAERLARYAVETGRVGELAAWRELAQRSGKSMQQLADEYLLRERAASAPR
jgi:hypothetical protein